MIARVDAPEDPGEEPRPWYVGRRAVSDVRTRDTVVVLWTSPLATKWFEAQSHTPGDVVLRRQLRCAQQIVEDYFDDIASATPVSVAPVLEAVPEPRPAGDDAITAEPATADEAGAEAPPRAAKQPEAA